MNDDSLGPTGQFPYGKLTPDDEGEISVGIAGDPQTETVHINFGTSIRSLGMRPEQAEQMAGAILRAACKARKELR